MSETTPAKTRRPLVWWGVALMVAAVIGGVLGAVGAVSRAGGALVDALTANVHATPMNAELDLEAGDYVVYEFTGTKNSVGRSSPRTVTESPCARPTSR